MRMTVLQGCLNFENRSFVRSRSVKNSKSSEELKPGEFLYLGGERCFFRVTWLLYERLKAFGEIPLL